MMTQQINAVLVRRAEQLAGEIRGVYSRGEFDLARHMMSSAYVLVGAYYVMNGQINVEDMDEVMDAAYHPRIKSIAEELSN